MRQVQYVRKISQSYLTRLDIQQNLSPSDNLFITASWVVYLIMGTFLHPFTYSMAQKPGCVLASARCVILFVLMLQYAFCKHVPFLLYFPTVGGESAYRPYSLLHFQFFIWCISLCMSLSCSVSVVYVLSLSTPSQLPASPHVEARSLFTCSVN